MYLQKFRFIYLFAPVAILCGAAVLELAVASKESRVSAQTVDEREVKADRLFQQSSELLKTLV